MTPLALWIALARPLAAAAPVDPLDVLKQATAPPSEAYYGRTLEIQWYGKRARASESVVYYKPPGRLRRETRAHGTRPAELTISNGSEEWIVIPSRRRAWSGQASKQPQRLLSQDEEWKLLDRNYEVRLASDDDEVAGRETWKLELTPRSAGKPSRSLWIDKETGLVLRVQNFHPDRSLASLFNFTQLSLPAELRDELFDYKPPPDYRVAEHRLSPQFSTLDKLRDAAASVPRAPAELPEGFVFESAGLVNVGSRRVTHVRYTDGLVSLSLFDSPVPIHWRDLPGEGGRERLVPGGSALEWSSRRRHYVLMGNVTRDLLRRLADVLKKGT